MKKYKVFLLIILSLFVFNISNVSAITAPPLIVVTSQSSGENYLLQDQISINWNSVNLNNSSFVDVYLKDDSISCPTGILGCQSVFYIARTANTGNYSWNTNNKMSGPSTGPNSISVRVGSKYKIKICDINTNICGESENYFSISDSITKTPSIKITHPNGGEVFTKGQAITIRWETSGYGDKSVLIAFDLVKKSENGTSNTFLISQTGLANDGLETVTIPLNTPSGANYGFRIYTYDPLNTAGGYSQYYRVDNSDGTFAILSEGCTLLTGNSSVTGESCPGNSVGATGNAYAFGNTLVKMGSKGEACKAWQTFLNDKANADLVTDGWCGKLTITAAKNWQKANGLKADGFLGALSRAKALLQ